jgi:hypothetical protein
MTIHSRECAQSMWLPVGCACPCKCSGNSQQQFVHCLMKFAVCGLYSWRKQPVHCTPSNHSMCGQTGLCCLEQHVLGLCAWFCSDSGSCALLLQQNVVTQSVVEYSVITSHPVTDIGSAVHGCKQAANSVLHTHSAWCSLVCLRQSGCRSTVNQGLCGPVDAMMPWLPECMYPVMC